MDTEINSTSSDSEETPQTESPEIEILDAEQTPSLPPPPKRSLRWLYGLPLAFALGLIAGYFIFAFPLQKKLAAAQSQIAMLQQNGSDSQQQVEVPKQVKRYDVPVDNFPAYGPADAPITIVEFSDYQCPFCKKWHDEVWPQIETKYGDKVRLVYRDFPLSSIHPNANPAAMAANCAADQGKYWEFHSALFSGQYPLSRQSYDSIAANLGLDAGKFASCIDTEKYKATIEADYQFASNLGVQSTPTFFINGLALVGAQPFDVFDKVISMELNGEIPKN